jgi:hypothetical protein
MQQGMNEKCISGMDDGLLRHDASKLPGFRLKGTRYMSVLFAFGMEFKMFFYPWDVLFVTGDFVCLLEIEFAVETCLESRVF